MLSSNWIRIFISLALGIAAGLVYGWAIDPVEYTDVTPGVLREDYRADYVLMVAEAFHVDYNSAMAARRLAVLGSESPSQMLSSTLEYARLNQFSQNEIALLQELLSAMQTYQPQGIDAP